MRTLGLGIIGVLLVACAGRPTRTSRAASEAELEGRVETVNYLPEC